MPRPAVSDGNVTSYADGGVIHFSLRPFAAGHLDSVRAIEACEDAKPTPHSGVTS
jgi:hypothetical protein